MVLLCHNLYSFMIHNNVVSRFATLNLLIFLWMMIQPDAKCQGGEEVLQSQGKVIRIQ